MQLNIKEALRLAGLSGKEMAALLGVAEGTFSGYVNGTHHPNPDKLRLIARHCGVSVDFLLGLTDDPTPADAQGVSADEMAHIKKYRGLDGYGKETVDMVTERELGRIAAQQQPATAVPFLFAAYGDTPPQDYTPADLEDLEAFKKLVDNHNKRKVAEDD